MDFCILHNIIDVLWSYRTNVCHTDKLAGREECVLPVNLLADTRTFFFIGTAKSTRRLNYCVFLVWFCYYGQRIISYYYYYCNRADPRAFCVLYWIRANNNDAYRIGNSETGRDEISARSVVPPSRNFHNRNRGRRKLNLKRTIDIDTVLLLIIIENIYSRKS